MKLPHDASFRPLPPLPATLAHPPIPAGPPALARPSAPPRTAILTSADLSFRQRVRDALIALRWQVREARGGAEALAHLDEAPAEALIVDSWLPDLDIGEFIAEFEKLYSGVDLVAVGEAAPRGNTVRSSRRNELLLALRRGQDGDGAAWNTAPVLEQEPWRAGPRTLSGRAHAGVEKEEERGAENAAAVSAGSVVSAESSRPAANPAAGSILASQRLAEFIGDHPAMLEVSRRIRLVAPHRTSVLIQGPSGTGKELVARAVHRLSGRAGRPFMALNCAAIPEALLEAELFGHTRGAFTGAVQGRTGRIEAAQGTLFLDEIGEMPMAFQAKLLRFMESGELQRVGENEVVKVDVRIVAATHRPLGLLTEEGKFRADLYYRLSVFLIRTPPLAGRKADLLPLTRHFLERMGRRTPAKSLSAEAFERLCAHSWPGNVRELEHVLERAWILAEERAEIGSGEIEFGDAFA